MNLFPQHTRVLFRPTLLASVVAMSFSPMTVAQTQDPQKPQKTLEVIEVTAQKRVESLQDVPVSITTINGDMLQSNNISQMEEMSAYVPNFAVTKSGQGYNIYMRGLGSGPNQGFEQTVGTYVDGIYRGRGVLMRSAFVDLAMVEVLRGPQSILFGMNTTAGALNLTTNNPNDYFEAGIATSYFTEGDKVDVEGFISGPLTDTLNARLVTKYENDQGYIYNASTDDTMPARESLVTRLTLDWQPTDDFNANLKIQHDQDSVHGRPLIVVAEPALIAAQAPILDQLGYYQLGYETARTQPALGEKEQEDASVDFVTLNLSYGMDNHDLSATTGWQSYDLDGSKDQDSTARVLMYSPEFSESYQQFSQEIRLASNLSGPLNYIAGAFYQTSDLRYQENSAVYPLQVRGLRDYGSDSRLWAVFAQMDYALTDKFSASLGLRYTDEHKQGFKQMSLVDPVTGVAVDQLALIKPPALAATLNQLGIPGLPGPAYVAMLGSSLPYLDPLLLGQASQNIQNPLFGTIEPHNIRAERDDSHVTPSVTLSYDLGDSMVYATVATGVKAGGFDARSNLAANFEFDPEEVIAYEVGSKLSLANGIAELNIAAFVMKFDDLQTSVFDGQVGFMVENAGQATSQGVELDGRWLITEDLTLTGSLGLMDFNWDSFAGAKCFTSTVLIPDNIEPNGRTCDLTGDTNILAPEVSASLNVDYIRYIFGDLQWRTSLDVNYQSEVFTSTDLNPLTKQGAYAKINARTAISSDAGWEVALVAKNLTDELTSNFAFDTPFSTGVYSQMIEPGRSVGLQLRYYFY
ncbi:TonB-dependent receptor [Shewanella sp. NIFS-20-20]|uniref:TonB-dependent receptor n=1 Tax=Shewanella sp. NIFS-20-20 TaxID=2853806 RepID=UPI001C493F7E|nr:TonB-dependent receptor [Shewanella sp. NIFS-20-20]MBV7317407.1 TonB-dependent receptor [Shewanella sp. NIFS-20-20]